MNDEDVRVDVYRAGRDFPRVTATHIPTGIVVTADQSPTQFRNRETALALLSELVAQRQAAT